MPQVVPGLRPTTVKTAVHYATAAALPSCVYNNGSEGIGATLIAAAAGALTVDSVLAQVNDRILVKDEVSTLTNGIYRVLNPGSVSVKWELVRSEDANSVSQLSTGMSVAVGAAIGRVGATNNQSEWASLSDDPCLPGASPITWAKVGPPNVGYVFPGFDYTTASIAEGDTLLVSVPWQDLIGTETLLIRQIRLEPSNDTAIFDCKILRSGNPAKLNSEYAFWVTGCQGPFMREYIWDYDDDDDAGEVHIWISNSGPGATDVRVLLNNRVVQ